MPSPLPLLACGLLLATASALVAGPALSIARGCAAGSPTAAAVTALCLERARADPHGAFVHVCGDAAEAAAAEADAWAAAQRAGGASPEAMLRERPLLGVPVAVKDNICTAGAPTTAGSAVLADYAPTFDAAAVEGLARAGAVVVGKTNLDEFGMGSTSEKSAHGPTLNPRDTSRAPGGSSGGSAAAVAAGCVPLALGTDTGGSIRQPAAWCGCVGLKPSYGRVSRRGLVAYASSTDVVGPLASCVADAALALSCLAGPDAADATSAAGEDAVPDYLGALEAVDAAGEKPLAGVRVGVLRATVDSARTAPEVAAATAAAAEALAGLGATVVDVALDEGLLRAACAAYYVNVMSEASANLARFDGVRYGARDAAAPTTKTATTRTRGAGLGAEVKQRILLGTFALSSGYADAYYKRAQRVRAKLASAFEAAFDDVDVLLSPTAPTAAYALGAAAAMDGVDVYADDLFTTPASMAGLPAVSVPSGVTEGGLPLGVQFTGRHLDEVGVLKVAYAYERAVEAAGGAGLGFGSFL